MLDEARTREASLTARAFVYGYAIEPAIVAPPGKALASRAGAARTVPPSSTAWRAQKGGLVGSWEFAAVVPRPRSRRTGPSLPW